MADEKAIIDVETFDIPAWLLRENEPEDWHAKFAKYYLPLGPTRTLLKAFTAYLLENYAEDAAAMRMSKMASAPHSWTIMARDWEWRARAKQYDAFEFGQTAQVVSAARQKIQDLALKAVESLEKALDNPRTQVAAAERILDRAGLPAKSVHVHEIQPFTSDDYAKAAEEVREWQAQLTKNSNG